MNDDMRRDRLFKRLLVPCVIAVAACVSFALLLCSSGNSQLLYHLSDGADYVVSAEFANDALRISVGSRSHSYEIAKTEKEGKQIEYVLYLTEDTPQEFVEGKAVVARRVIVPNANHEETIVGLWEDRTQYEFFTGGRSVEVRSVEFHADGTGSFQMLVGDEQSFNGDDVASLTILYEHFLEWKQGEHGHFQISDKTSGNSFELEIARVS